jgi:simple sugar transport system permease protein
VTDQLTPAAPVPEGRATGWRRYRWVIAAVAGFVAVSLVRVFTGETDLTSGGTMAAALALAVPIGMAALGGMWSERAGVINIGLEGMMTLGTWFGAAGALFGHSVWIGLVSGIIGGALGGLLHALACVTFGVDHIVSGVAINILAAGLTKYLSVQFFADLPGGGGTQSPELPDFPSVTVPGVSTALASVERHGWPVVSDLAGVIHGFTTNVNVLTIIAIALVIGSFFVLWRTPLGLRLRSCGENPVAAESLGVSVYRMKYLAVAASGAFAGLGGVFLAMVASSNYQEDQTGGRGYIGLAAMIFGNWRPGGLAMGAGLFGYTDALQLRGASSAVHALLLLVAVGMVALAFFNAYQHRFVTSMVSIVIGALLLWWFLGTDEVPRQLVTYSPHITTLLVLALASQRLRMPAADGMRYRKGMG